MNILFFLTDNEEPIKIQNFESLDEVTTENKTYYKVVSEDGIVLIDKKSVSDFLFTGG